jgi:O-antigen/teichoic acid export membrane protein
MSTFRSAARNVAIVASSHLVMWVATLVFTVAQAHLLGPARFGELSLALSYAVFLTVVIDFGLGIHLSRMVAQRSGGTEALAATIVIRCALWVVAVPCLWVATVLLGYGSELQGTILVLALSVLLIGISGSIEAFLRGHERFVLPSIGAIAYRLTAAAIGIFLLVLGQGLVVVAGAFFIGAAANLALLLIGMRERAWLRRSIDLRMASRLFRTAIPLGMWWIIAAFVFSTDMVILALLAPAENVGWYAAAYRLFNVAALFPAITVGMVLSPVLSRASLGPRRELRQVIEKALTVHIVAGVAVLLVLGLFADQIIALLYPAGAYASAAEALRLLAPRLAFLYLNSVFVYTLIALHQERRLLGMAITFAVLTPLANLAAIPLLEQNGAALVSSLTEACWFVWLVRAMPHDLLSWDSARTTAKAISAAALAALVGGVVGERGFLIALPLVLAAYGGALLFLGVLKPSDTRALRSVAREEPAAAEITKTVALPAGEEVA